MSSIDLCPRSSASKTRLAGHAEPLRVLAAVLVTCDEGVDAQVVGARHPCRGPLAGPAIRVRQPMPGDC